MIKSDQNLNTEAILDFDNALKIDSNNVTFIQSRAISKAMTGRKDAISDFNRAIQLDSNNPDTYINRALYYLNFNIKGDYCSDLKKAISLGAEKAKSILKDNCK